MKTLFVKYNRERITYFQTVTKILQDDCGFTFAVKEPLSAKAANHIKAIYSNYHMLSTKYDIKLCRPLLTDNGIQFEMAKGESLESLLIKALSDDDEVDAINIINIYLEYLNKLVGKRNIVFKPCGNFREIFGEWNYTGTEDVIEIANVDLILSNLFLYKKELTQIDYEWVFDFPIPKSFIIWRTFHLFFNCHQEFVDTVIFQKIVKCIIPDYFSNQFSSNDQNFYRYVFGESFSYILNKNILKPGILIISELSQTKSELSQTKSELSQTQSELSQTRDELSHVIDSRTWKWGNKIADLLRFIVPPNTIRRKVIKKMLLIK